MMMMLMVMMMVMVMIHDGGGDDEYDDADDDLVDAQLDVLAGFGTKHADHFLFATWLKTFDAPRLEIVFNLFSCCCI